MKDVGFISAAILCFCAPVEAREICQIVTHEKLSIADFAESPLDTDNFYFEDETQLTREGTLRVAGRSFEIESNDYRMIYECAGLRHDPCIGKSDDPRFLDEARIDFAAGVVVEMSAKRTEDTFPFGRGGVADSGLTIWKISSCEN